MSLEVEPEQLAFARPFTVAVKAILTLRNRTSDTIAFKVKTTAPKQYCVRPNSGHVGAGQLAEIEVILQPMKEDPPTNARCRDKFMVQSVMVSPEELDLPMQQLWTSVDGERQREIFERKLKCVYLQPGGQRSLNGTTSLPILQNGSQYEMAASRDEMGRHEDGTGRTANRASSYAMAMSDDPRRSQALASQQAPPPAPSTGSASRANTSRDAETTVDSLKAKLAHYEEALHKARKEATEAKNAQAQAEMQLKQRITYQKAVDTRAAEQRASSADSKALSEQRYSATLVAIVALISFLVGVIFF